MTLGIATNSVDKINGIKIAFARFFQIEETELKVIHCSVNSGVSEQPFNEETYIGAKNRVNALISSTEETLDYYISCEAGIEEFIGNFFNVQVICIFEQRSQNYIFGKSAGWPIPSKDIEIIKKTNLNNYLKSRGITSCEDLLGEGYSRAGAITQATEHALASTSKLTHIF